MFVEERFVWKGEECKLLSWKSVVITGRGEVFVLGSGESVWRVEVLFEAVVWEKDRSDD